MMSESMSNVIPRGLRNDNPLNIRYYSHNDWMGTIPDECKNDMDFEEFKASRYGFRAAFKLFKRYFAMGFQTIQEIIYRWAPPSDRNYYHSYVDAVCQYTGYSVDKVIFPENKEAYLALAEAMFKVETGITIIEANKLLGINYYEEMSIGYDLFRNNFYN